MVQFRPCLSVGRLVRCIAYDRNLNCILSFCKLFAVELLLVFQQVLPYLLSFGVSMLVFFFVVVVFLYPSASSFGLTFRFQFMTSRGAHTFTCSLLQQLCYQSVSSTNTSLAFGGGMGVWILVVSYHMLGMGRHCKKIF